MEEKYSLLYRFKPKEFGAGIFGIHMEECYPEFFKSINYKEFVPERNKIWILENPYFYSYPFIKRFNDYSFLRRDYTHLFPYKCRLTGGFSYYKMFNGIYKSYFPTIYDVHFSRNSYPSIGYYIRTMRTESNLAFIDLINKLPNDIPIVTMGTKESLEKYLSNRKNWYHTYDSNIFWKKCSHYFYFRCSDFIDPFPHSLLEAIQSGHRIISPKNNRRNFIDGIDDLLSFIEYDETFIEANIGKPCDLLTGAYWKTYIENLICTDFENPGTIYSKSLYDYACKML